MRIAFIDSGTYYHHRTFNDPAYSRYFAANLYLPELSSADLSSYDCLYVASRQDIVGLWESRRVFSDFLDAGKTVVSMGDNYAKNWLPHIRWTETEINYWWWLTPGADSGLSVASPSHPLFQHMGLAEMTWHRHGVLTPPEGAVSLVDAREGGSVLVDDTHSTPGRLIASTLDPCYHHGSYFMPNTTKFLDAFLPWLAQGAR